MGIGERWVEVDPAGGGQRDREDGERGGGGQVGIALFVGNDHFVRQNSQGGHRSLQPYVGQGSRQEAWDLIVPADHAIIHISVDRAVVHGGVARQVQQGMPFRLAGVFRPDVLDEVLLCQGMYIQRVDPVCGRFRIEIISATGCLRLVGVRYKLAQLSQREPDLFDLPVQVCAPDLDIRHRSGFHIEGSPVLVFALPAAHAPQL